MLSVSLILIAIGIEDSFVSKKCVPNSNQDQPNICTLFLNGSITRLIKNQPRIFDLHDLRQGEIRLSG